MNNNDAGSSAIHLLIRLMMPLALFGLAACGGGGGTTTAGTSVSHTTPAQPTIGTITSVDNAAITTPYLTGSTVTHYCDCQTGNAIQPAAGCVAGSDTTGDGSAAKPFRNIGYPGFDQTKTYSVGDKISSGSADYVSLINGNTGNYPNGPGTAWAYINPTSPAVSAATWLNSRTSGNNTVALCQGGVWNAPVSQFSLNLSGNTYCPAGQTCSEFREYSTAWGAGVKPVIYGNTGSSSDLFFLGNGQRIMNLHLVGFGTGNSSDQEGFFLYRWVPSGPNPGVHDDTIWNVDMDGFDLAVHVATAENNNITIQGNHIVNSATMGFLGSCSNLNLNYNYFKDNGGDNMFDHAIYFGSHLPVTGINAIGNYIEGFSTTTGSTTCQGDPLVMHGEFTDVVVSGNTIIEDPAKSGPGCWGLSANNGGYAIGTYVRNARFSDNIIVNGGNLGLDVDNCPYCLIENNLIIQDSANGGYGIAIPAFGARRQIGQGGIPTSCTTAAGNVCEDDPTTDYTIRNNTIYFTANASNGMQAGIYLGVAGSSETQTGHQVYNNTVTYAATSHGLNSVFCFGYPLPASAYTVINNNNCYSADSTYAWEGTRGPAPTYTITRYSLAQWNGFGFDNANTAVATADTGFTLSAYPYIAWSDSSLAYQLFDSGTNYFSPSGAPLLGYGKNGPASDITGTARPNPPAIGAYE